MFAAIAVLTVIDKLMKVANPTVTAFAPVSLAHKIACSLFFANFMFLMALGSSPAAAPFVYCSKAATGLYFGYFFLILPLLA